MVRFPRESVLDEVHTEGTVLDEVHNRVHFTSPCAECILQDGAMWTREGKEDYTDNKLSSGISVRLDKVLFLKSHLGYVIN